MAAVYLDHVFKYMNHPDALLVAKVVSAFDSIMTRLPKEVQMLQIPLIQRAIEINGVQTVDTKHSLANEDSSSLVHMYKKKSPVLAMFKIQKGCQTMVAHVQAAIMHGSVHTRIAAAFVFKYLLDFAPAECIKKEIIKICGALIRVVNDKFCQELKLQIFLCLQLIQKRNADSAKAMQAQL
jgi:hypothetical protein